MSPPLVRMLKANYCLVNRILMDNCQREFAYHFSLDGTLYIADAYDGRILKLGYTP